MTVDISSETTDHLPSTQDSKRKLLQYPTGLALAELGLAMKGISMMMKGKFLKPGGALGGG